MTALNKVGIQYLRTEFCCDAHRFLEQFVKCLLSTVASRSLAGHGMSCFCLGIMNGGDDIAPFQLFNKLLHGVLEQRWKKGSEVEACRTVGPVLCAGTAAAGAVVHEETL